MALPVVLQAPVCGGHHLLQALDPVPDIALLALAAPLVLQHRGREGGDCVSANTQMPPGDPCIPVEAGRNLQNAPRACWGCGRAVKNQMTCSTLTPR